MTTVTWNSAQGKTIFMASIYLDGNVNGPPAEMINLLEEKSEEHMVLGLDSNAHSTLLFLFVFGWPRREMLILRDHQVVQS